MKENTLKIIYTITLFVFTINSYSQAETDSIQNKKDTTENINMDKKLKFGSGFGLNFVGGTNINISPNLTYNISSKTAFGLGLQFNYLSLKDIKTTTTLGVNTVFQYTPSPKIMSLVEFAQLRVSSKSEIDNIKTSFWDSALFVGAGYFITKKISLGAKYNLLYNKDKSVYTSPIIPFVNITF